MQLQGETARSGPARTEPSGGHGWNLGDRKINGSNPLLIFLSLLFLSRALGDVDNKDWWAYDVTEFAKPLIRRVGISDTTQEILS